LIANVRKWFRHGSITSDMKLDVISRVMRSRLIRLTLAFSSEQMK